MVDSKDLLIVDALKRDAKASVVEIAKKTGLPGTTVHNRIKRLQHDGIIKGYTIRVDNKLLGRDVAAFVSITIDYMDLKAKKLEIGDLTEKISKIPFVEEINLVTSETDILVKARVGSINELNELVMRKLRNFDGVEKTKTMVVLEEVRD